MFLYMLTESVRISIWRDKYYHPSDDTVVNGAPPPPKNLILTLAQKFWELLR
jgi:hypothetical protein